MYLIKLIMYLDTSICKYHCQYQTIFVLIFFQISFLKVTDHCTVLSYSNALKNAPVTKNILENSINVSGSAAGSFGTPVVFCSFQTGLLPVLGT